MANVSAKTLNGAILENVAQSARIISDEFNCYHGIGPSFDGGHHTVCRSRGEHVRGDIHTNTIEGLFAIFKRGSNGVYHSVSRKHLRRHLSEFEFRYNNRKLDDGARTVAAIREADGHAPRSGSNESVRLGSESRLKLSVLVQ